MGRDPLVIVTSLSPIPRDLGIESELGELMRYRGKEFGGFGGLAAAKTLTESSRIGFDRNIRKMKGFFQKSQKVASTFRRGSILSHFNDIS